MVYSFGRKGFFKSLEGIIMAYEIKLTDREYEILEVEAQKSGLQAEALLHEMIQRLSDAAPKKYQMSEHEFTEKLYREGKIRNLATRRSLTGEEHAERERLAKLFATDKLASDMVIEDRGPY
jgi:hypothetical protein